MRCGKNWDRDQVPEHHQESTTEDFYWKHEAPFDILGGKYVETPKMTRIKLLKKKRKKPPRRKPPKVKKNKKKKILKEKRRRGKKVKKTEKVQGKSSEVDE